MNTSGRRMREPALFHCSGFQNVRSSKYSASRLWYRTGATPNARYTENNSHVIDKERKPAMQCIKRTLVRKFLHMSSFSKSSFCNWCKAGRKDFDVKAYGSRVKSYLCFDGSYDGMDSCKVGSGAVFSDL